MPKICNCDALTVHAWCNNCAYEVRGLASQLFGENTKLRADNWALLEALLEIGRIVRDNESLAPMRPEAAVYRLLLDIAHNAITAAAPGQKAATE